MLAGCLAEFGGVTKYRNIKLHCVSYRLARAVGGGLLDECPVRTELYSGGVAMGLSQHEVRHTMESAFRRGINLPPCLLVLLHVLQGF